MNSADLCYLTAGQLSRLIQQKEVSPVEIIEAHLARISALEPKLNSFITVLHDQALAAARRAEAEIQSGKYRGALHGIPVGLKDLFAVKGVRTSSGCKLFDTHVADRDCAIATRLRNAGAIIVGKTNTNPLAYGPTSDTGEYDYGHMRNPWNPDFISGGSSGGSGSAAAAGQCTLTIGSDTGGSVRIPSALCGLVGLKPTYGRVSRYGFTPLSWSLDHAGPLTRSTEDCALVMNAIAGYDPKDPASADVQVPDYTKALTGDIRGVRIGLPKEYFEAPLDSQVYRSIQEAIGVLSDLGATITEVSLPLYTYCETISGIILMAEAAACHKDLARINGAKLNWPLRLRLESGLFLPAVDYIQAQQARSLFTDQSLGLLKEVDLLLSPTVPITASLIGEIELQVGSAKMGVIAAHTQYNAVYNLNGFPSITVPCGFSKQGLPIGLQLAGRPFDESKVLQVAHAYEQTTDWNNRRPSL